VSLRCTQVSSSRMEFGVVDVERFRDRIEVLVSGRVFTCEERDEDEAMRCLRCGKEAEHPGPYEGWACRACDFEWEEMAEGMSYVFTGDEEYWRDVPNGCLGIFSWELEP